VDGNGIVNVADLLPVIAHIREQQLAQMTGSRRRRRRTGTTTASSTASSSVTTRTRTSWRQAIRAIARDRS
jgi:hypothetical protein